MRVESELVAGTLLCPSCGGQLAPRDDRLQLDSRLDTGRGLGAVTSDLRRMFP